jgi:hypothetical protein
VSNTHNMIVAELRTLLRLTEAEIQIAETRRAQARTRAVERELAQNADNARERARLIAQTLRRLGGVPDIVTMVVGRLGATAKAGLEQAQSLPEALLGDLALEHQLQDRARYLKALGTAANERRVVSLAERLDEAHGATVEWLTVVLAEVALGGPAALRPTPVQAVLGAGLSLAKLPVRTVSRGVNGVADRAAQMRNRAETTADDLTTTAGEVKDAVIDVVGAGRDASLQEAEEAARRDGADDVADALRETRRDLGALTAEELPVPGYAKLTQPAAIRAVKKLQAPQDVRAVIDFEEAHKNRPSVISAAQTRLAAIAKDVVTT